jgi:hypothetical protein
MDESVKAKRPHDPPLKKHQLGVMHGCVKCRRYGGTMKPYKTGRIHFPECPPPGAPGVSEKP